MNSSQHVRVVLPEAHDEAHCADHGRDPVSAEASLAAPLRQSLARTRQWLLDAQHPDGHWEAELEGDTILESEYILLLAYLGREHSALARKLARTITAEQLPGGGWSSYPGGPVDVSVSVKAYFALKLTGHDLSAEYMYRARTAILEHGGADAVNTFTRFYLALLGQISYEQCPSVPPEVMLLPEWFPVHLHAVSSWSRTMIVPLAIVSSLQPVRAIEPERGIRELLLSPPETWDLPRCPGLESPRGWWNWDRFFRRVDRLLKWCQHHGALPLRRQAVEAARQWIVDHFAGSEGLGAIFPPMIWSIVALRALGYADESPELEYCHQHLFGLVLDDEQGTRVQPCKSPVWDTAFTLTTLIESGVPSHDDAIERARRWLLDHQVTRPGDWSARVTAEPGGWCFEHQNDFYPDVDDTSMAIMALGSRFGSIGPAADLPVLRLVGETSAGDLAAARQTVAELDRTAAAIERAQAWILAMQNRDGGWAAFDRDNNREFLCYVPFADHNAMIDPSSPDITGRVLESLGQLGCRIGEPSVDRAVAYLRRTQEADGAWYGRWGVNYIYGTWAVLCGLRSVGIAADDPAVAAGAQWLIAHQQPSGGWGESPDTYAHPELRGQGPVTASQTAWALLGLIAAGRERHPSVARGVRTLLARQRGDGTWDEPQFTGTGFPRVFYLRYHMYRIYFPLMALARYAAVLEHSGQHGRDRQSPVGYDFDDVQQQAC